MCGQNDEIALLLLINGPPGAGKSAVARRYVEEHPLALLVEIDALRVAMGGWAQHDESKLLARTLALALARAHLSAGHDVVIPQYLGRTDFVDALEAVASEVAAGFTHLVLTDEVSSVVERFQRRRIELTSASAAHPQADVSDTDVSAAVVDAVARLSQMTLARSNTRVIRVPPTADQLYGEVLAALKETSS